MKKLTLKIIAKIAIRIYPTTKNIMNWPGLPPQSVLVVRKFITIWIRDWKNVPSYAIDELPMFRIVQSQKLVDEPNCSCWRNPFSRMAGKILRLLIKESNLLQNSHVRLNKYRWITVICWNLEQFQSSILKWFPNIYNRSLIRITLLYIIHKLINNFKLIEVIQSETFFTTFQRFFVIYPAINNLLFLSLSVENYSCDKNFKTSVNHLW